MLFFLVRVSVPAFFSYHKKGLQTIQEIACPYFGQWSRWWSSQTSFELIVLVPAGGALRKKIFCTGKKTTPKGDTTHENICTHVFFFHYMALSLSHRHVFDLFPWYPPHQLWFWKEKYSKGCCYMRLQYSCAGSSTIIYSLSCSLLYTAHTNQRWVTIIAPSLGHAHTHIHTNLFHIHTYTNTPPQWCSVCTREDGRKQARSMQHIQDANARQHATC